MIKELNRKYINLSLCFGILLIVVLSYLAFAQIRKLNNSNIWVIHSHKVIEQTEDILIEINYIESVIRAYIITGDEKYISNLNTAFIAIQNSILKLQAMTINNQTQLNSTIELKNLIGSRINDINYKLSIYKSSGLKKLLTLPNKGDITSKQIRLLIKQIIITENTVLANRMREVYDHFILINTLILGCGILSITIIFIGILLLNQQIGFRNKAENKLRSSEDELYKLAYYDALTGLANRTLLHQSIENLISKTREDDKIALLFIDLDNFKKINDSFGHEIGDSLLNEYATRLKENISNQNIIAHLGGDEFVVLLTDSKSKNDILDLAKNIMRAVSGQFTIKTHKIFVTSSIGISTYPSNGQNSHTLLKNADIAMHKAKELGKNNIQFCDPAFTQQAEEYAQIDYELHRALSNNEFYLVYQPIISLSDNRIASVEVLIRWDRPNIGTVYPDNFIKMAESNGLIMPIGDWMLRQACTEANAWANNPMTPYAIKLSVNVSTRQFLLSDFAKTADTILKETNFDPSLIELEITESVLLENSYSNLLTLNTLKNMGIKISIDDFGTGYSSLSYLRSFQIDKLKIDRSFINELNHGNFNSSIITSIINMAHNLNIAVLAEGVETEEQLQFLKKAHCDEVQGYYYSRPLTAKEFEIFIKEYNQTKMRT